jgi:uncharacterized surface protein with fasciclin (FAS1) repeats
MRRLVTRGHRLAAAAALALIAPLAACAPAGDDAASEQSGGEATGRTLAAAIAGAPELSTISRALTEAGLADVFDGPGSYTVLAPNDQAFAALGSGKEAITEPAHRAELVAILRGHILPGHLTPDAIRQAIETKNGPVTMRTLDDRMVTFAADGKKITVSDGGGAKATVSDETIVATNGVVLPVDGMIKRPPAPAGGAPAQ